jgi:hypothetical protein
MMVIEEAIKIDKPQERKASLRASVEGISDDKIVPSHDQCLFCISNFKGATEKDRLYSKKLLLQRMR